MSRYYRDRLAQINDSVRDGRILGTSIDWNKKSTVLKQVADELLLAGKAMATEQELTGETADRFMAELKTVATKLEVDSAVFKKGSDALGKAHSAAQTMMSEHKALSSG